MTEYVLVSLAGVAVIAALAWGIDWWWRRRHPGVAGGAGAYLMRLVDGYELTPDGRKRRRAPGAEVASDTWRCAISDDTDDARQLVLGVTAHLDRVTIDAGSKQTALTKAGSALLLGALAADSRTVASSRRALTGGRRRARRESRHPAVAPSLHGDAEALAGEVAHAHSVVARMGPRSVTLNATGRGFAAALIAARTSQFEAGADALGARGALSDDWMPADGYRDRGGVNQPY